MPAKPTEQTPFEMMFPAGLPDGVSAFTEIARRNYEAFAHTATLIAEASNEIAASQLAFLKSLAAPDVRQQQQSGDVSELITNQLAAGRRAAEDSFEHVRHMSERMSQCYHDVAEEFASCARDNLAKLQPEKPAAPMAAHAAAVMRPKASA